MIIHEAVYDFIQTKSSITNLVSTSVYYLILPDDASLPAIAIAQVGWDNLHSLDGVVQQAKPIVRLNCYADKLTSVYAITEALRAELDGYSGAMGDISRASVVMTDMADGNPIEPKEGDSQFTFFRWVDFAIEHTTV